MDKNPLQPQSGQGQVSLPEPVAHNEQPSPAPGQVIPQIHQTQQPQADPVSTPASDGRPMAATPMSTPDTIQAEGDILGQEWLTIVDNLVRQNIQDPRKLSKAFEKVKASYISKRYGKELKRSDNEG